MNALWELVIILGISQWGTSSYQSIQFKTKEECFETLQYVKLSSGSKDSSTAFCRPIEKKK